MFFEFIIKCHTFKTGLLSFFVFIFLLLLSSSKICNYNLNMHLHMDNDEVRFLTCGYLSIFDFIMRNRIFNRRIKKKKRK